MPNDITYMWNIKYDANELIYKTETDSQTQRTDPWLPKWGRERDGGGVWGQRMQNGNIQNAQVLVYRIWNYIQHPMINNNGKEYKQKCDSLCCTPETNNTENQP